MSLWVDVCHVVTSIVVSTVDQHCMQGVADRGGVSNLQKLVQTKLLRKLIPIIYMYMCYVQTYIIFCVSIKHSSL